MKPRLAKIRILLEHDLSPAPIFAVFVGYWLPLDWLLSNGILGGASPLEKAYAIASSAVFNYGLVALVLSGLIYLIAGTLYLFKFSLRGMVRTGMSLCAWLGFLTITKGVLYRMLFHSAPMALGFQWFWRGVVVVLALLMTWKGWNPRKVLAIPMGLGAAILAAGLILVACEGSGVGLPPPVRAKGPVSARPDILLITLDATSARHLTMYGSKRPTSPNLQAFANGALTLDHFYANANWTRSGIASLLNGARPWTHQGDLGAPRQEVVNSQNLVKQLALAGYNTDYVGTNLFASPSFQRSLPFFHRGRLFVSVPVGILGDLGAHFPSLVRSLWLGPVPMLYSHFDFRHFLEKTRTPIAAAERLMGQAPSNRPSFFWLHLVTEHDPYAAPPPFMGSFERSPLARSVRTTQTHYGFGAKADPCYPGIYEGRYDEAIRCMDDGLGGLFAWMKATGRYDRTLIVITADHGESFSHGYGGHGGPLLSEDLIHIPCLIKRPYQHSAERDDRLYEQCDLAPTLLQMVGLPIPVGIEGYPISRKPEGLPVFSMNHDLAFGPPTFSVAIRLGDWKYVEHWGHWTVPWPRRELYDLAEDPGEHQNLVATRPDKAADLRGRILMELARRHINPEQE